MADVGDMNAVLKLAPHSSLRLAKFEIGLAIYATLSTTLSATELGEDYTDHHERYRPVEQTT